MSGETNLADLLALNLHNFEDEVRNIVDKASKELSMEKTLGELNQTWSVMEFEYEDHGRTSTPLLKSSEELIETLEENQVQLQNMMTSKYIGFFQEEVSTWQKRLATADSVITIWFEVQRTWSYLESIFIGSDDIRKQLPMDSKRFDGIDVDFKVNCQERESPCVRMCEYVCTYVAHVCVGNVCVCVCAIRCCHAEPCRSSKPMPRPHLMWLRPPISKASMISSRTFRKGAHLGSVTAVVYIGLFQCMPLTQI